MTATLNAAKTQNLTRAQIQTVAAHELGHVLGLAHETTTCALMNPNPDYMTFFCGGWVNTPQQDDVNGVNAMY
jgi:predicted Zn-dependent protease